MRQSNSSDILLARLDRVRRTGQGRWVARCPAHDDMGPSLSIRELDGGRVLIHCFAGCDANQIVQSVGLELSNLFPDRLLHGDNNHRTRPEHRPFPARDILRCVAFEALVAATACASMLAGRPFSPMDRERLMLAAERLKAACSLAGGRYD